MNTRCSKTAASHRLVAAYLAQLHSAQVGMRSQVYTTDLKIVDKEVENTA